MTRRADTLLVTAGRDPGASFDFVNPPLVRGSTVLHESVAEMKARIASRNAGADLPVTYGIYGTPTHHAFYEALNALEGGHASWALPSGLTACTVPILAFVQQGDHVLVPDSVYWPTRRFCRDTLTRYGVETTFYDPRIGERGRAAVEALFRPTTRVMFLESPGSLTFEMQDVPLLAEIARARGAVSMIDNTWATPLYCQPLALGVDVSIHAATKYICGHSDVIMGTVTSNEAAWPRLRETFHHYGLTTSPDDVYLA
ncbi:MAG: trans-sulfuration enzyme family protein, partial [Betaproteobacteria bacterium]